MNDDKFVTVYVYPDGDVFEEPVDYKSNDYKVMKTTYCDECGDLIEPQYDKQFTSCSCGLRGDIDFYGM